MASSLLTLLDDIATLLDDVAVMTKIATKKTAGVLGDDLALNAQQVSGVKPDRELPVVWAVAKGSFVNKAILVPAALLISTFLPWAITPLMVIGGAFLCYEGALKIGQRFLHSPAEKEARVAELLEAAADETIDLVAHEKEKIKGAIRTDFILSAEIIVITLGTVADADFTRQLATLVTIALLITVGVYGLVAGIVKLDDGGLYLSRRESAPLQAIGHGIVRLAPLLMKFLTIAGTAAMFLVGGGILVHAIPALHHAVVAVTPEIGPDWLLPTLAEGVVGVLLGIAVLAAVMSIRKMRGLPAAPAH